MIRSENKYWQYMELIPVLLFVLCALQFILYLFSVATQTHYLLRNLHEGIRHFMDCSLIGCIIPLFYIKYIDKWYGVPNVCLYGLLALWLNNFPIILFEYAPGTYFMISSIIIYCFVLIFALMTLTNRFLFTKNAKNRT